MAKSSLNSFLLAALPASRLDTNIPSTLWKIGYKIYALRYLQREASRVPDPEHWTDPNLDWTESLILTES
jgi:hypothetical protein